MYATGVSDYEFKHAWSAYMNLLHAPDVTIPFVLL